VIDVVDADDEEDLVIGDESEAIVSVDMTDSRPSLSSRICHRSRHNAAITDLSFLGIPPPFHLIPDLQSGRLNPKTYKPYYSEHPTIKSMFMALAAQQGQHSSTNREEPSSSSATFWSSHSPSQHQQYQLPAFLLRKSHLEHQVNESGDEWKMMEELLQTSEAYDEENLLLPPDPLQLSLATSLDSSSNDDDIVTFSSINSRPSPNGEEAESSGASSRFTAKKALVNRKSSSSTFSAAPSNPVDISPASSSSTLLQAAALSSFVTVKQKMRAISTPGKRTSLRTASRPSLRDVRGGLA